MRLRHGCLIGLALLLAYSVVWAAQHRRDRFEEPLVVRTSVPTAVVRLPQEPAPASAPAPASRPVDVGPPSVDPGWTAEIAASAGIPTVAVAAYARATLMAPATCHLGWTTLAGIGWVESQHGTVGGRRLDADGRSSTAIAGPVLDGSGAVAAIPAPVGRKAVGDKKWDHAEGPMQFLSRTWQTWASDGDGDGVEDPHDIDDAAYAAALYLCAGGEDLASGAGWARAVYSYNHAQVYVDAVRIAASTYAARTA